MKLTTQATIVLILLVLLITSLSWYSLLNIPVNFNGSILYAKFGESFENLLERNNLDTSYKQFVELGNSNFITIKSKLKFREGNETFGLNKKIFYPMKVVTIKRRLSWERMVTEYSFYEPKEIIVGKGPFIKLERAGVPSIKLVSKSDRYNFNHELLAKKGRGALFRRTDGFKEKILALTYDDGPSIYTPILLNVLQKYHVKATFFVIGKHAERHPEILRQIAKQGHLIGNHSYSHLNLRKSSKYRIDFEVRKTEEIVKKYTGIKPSWFRPPMGIYDERLLQYLKSRNYKVSLWTIDTEDWKNQNADLIFSKVQRNLVPGAVVLMHDGGGSRKGTVRATEMIIKTALRKGFVFVTLADFAKIRSQ
ncbi:MAG: polysaccharide deacetylase family protein [Actinobacteria bacterium]|nr:polysaccharide deacetylase family protein [Actinomycetota bacterium]